MPHLLYPFLCRWTLRLLHVLVTVNNASVNIRVCVSFCTSVFVFFTYIPRSGIAGYMVVLFLVFWETSVLFSTVAAPTIPANRIGGSPFLHLHNNICYLLLFWWQTGGRWCVTVGLICISLMISDKEASFHIPVGHLYALFGKTSIQDFCPLFNWAVSFFKYWVCVLFIYFLY